MTPAEIANKNNNVMNNRKRTKSRSIQSIVCTEKITRNEKEIKNPAAGKMKQIKHPNLPNPSENDPWGISKAQDFEKAMLQRIKETRITN